MTDASIELADRYRHADAILSTELGTDEVLMMNADLADYFGVRDSAADIWRGFAESATVAEVVEQLIATYDVEPDVCRAETLVCVGELVELGLLVAAD